jgi:hypothetical protein
LITPHLSYHMTLSTRLHFFDLSVELGFSDISGPILSSRYDSIVSTNVKSDLVVRAVHVTILIVTNVRSDLGGLNLISPEQFCEVDRRNFIIYFYSLGNWMTPAQAQSSQSVAAVSSTRVPFGPRFSIPIAGFSDSFVSGPQSRPRSVEAIRSGHQRWTQSTAIPWLSGCGLNFSQWLLDLKGPKYDVFNGLPPSPARTEATDPWTLRQVTQIYGETTIPNPNYQLVHPQKYRKL